MKHTCTHKLETYVYPYESQSRGKVLCKSGMEKRGGIFVKMYPFGVVQAKRTAAGAILSVGFSTLVDTFDADGSRRCGQLLQILLLAELPCAQLPEAQRHARAEGPQRGVELRPQNRGRDLAESARRAGGYLNLFVRS